MRACKLAIDTRGGLHLNHEREVVTRLSEVDLEVRDIQQERVRLRLEEEQAGLLAIGGIGVVGKTLEVAGGVAVDVEIDVVLGRRSARVDAEEVVLRHLELYEVVSSRLLGDQEVLAIESDRAIGALWAAISEAASAKGSQVGRQGLALIAIVYGHIIGASQEQIRELEWCAIQCREICGFPVCRVMNDHSIITRAENLQLGDYVCQPNRPQE